MCGLWGGLSTTLNKVELDIIHQLGMLSIFRGTDSTGVLTFTQKKNKNWYYLLKKPVDPVGFLMDSTNDYIYDGSVRLVAGHARAATIGKVTMENAHPFDIGNIIGMHNGSVRGLVSESRGDVTDSQVIMEMIDQDGIDDAIEEIDRLRGAYALVYCNKKEQTINFIRNNDRPLSYMRGLGNCLFWASEKGMLQFIKDRASGHFDEIHSFNPGVLHSIKIGSTDIKRRQISGGGTHTSHFSTSSDTVTVRSAYRYPYKSEVAKEENPFRESQQDCRLETTNSTASVPLLPLPAQLPAIIKPPSLADRVIDNVARSEENKKKKFPKNYRGFNGLHYGQGFIQNCLNDGCANCTNQPSINDEVYWFNFKEFLCGTCALDATTVGVVTNGQLFRGSLVKDAN